jgi:hypothetical protein
MKVFKFFLFAFLVLIVVGIAIIYSLPSKRNISSFPDCLLFAHRAFTPCFPENSLEAILFLKNRNVKAVEIDIRKTADNKWVLFHDEDGSRLLGINKTISSLEFEELNSKNLIFNKQLSNCKIPLFTKVLDRISDSLYFYLDVKEPTISNAKELVEIIKLKHLENTVLLATPNTRFVLYIKLFYPDIKVALEGFNAGKEVIFTLIPLRLQPDFLSSFHNRTNKEHVHWLEAHSLLNAKIVYGVTKKTFNANVNARFKKMLVDYDSTIFINSNR